MEGSVRQPVVAGAFYPGQREELARAVSVLLGQQIERGPSSLLSPCGLIAPHAGYPYSGPTAAAGYRAVAGRGRPSLVVILGANHTGFGNAIALDDHRAWRTPLGDVPVDGAAVEKLVDAGWPVDRSAFVREHSVEVQIPFLQILWGDAFQIVPVCVQRADRATLADAGRTLASALRTTGATLVVASSDFTHYEPDETARRRDHRAIEPILDLDAERFLRLCEAERLSICGAGAIAILMHAASELGLGTASLVEYSTSGDTSGDRSAVVGYAAVSFCRRDDG